MWKLLQALASAAPGRRACERPEPGPLASLARDYAALDAAVWLEARRKQAPVEAEGR
jgi:hypothetical protein